MNSREKMHDFFDVSESYNLARYSQVLSLLRLNRVGTVLDIGPGPRSIIEHISADNKIAVEINRTFVEVLSKKNITCIQQDIQDGFHLDDHKHVDLVFCLEIIEHLYYLEKFFESIKTVLKDNGKIVFSVPNDVGFFTRRLMILFKGSLFGRKTYDPYKEQHIRFFTIQSLRYVLEIHGFKICSIHGLNISLPIGKRGYLEHLVGHLNLQRWMPNLFSTHFVAIAEKP